MTGLENIKLPWPNWKIIRSLGHGGFGCVYEAERELFGRKEKAAIKVLTIPKDQSDVEADYTDGYDEASIRKKYENYRDKVIQEYQLMSEMKGNTNIVNCDDFAAVPLSNGIGWKVYIRMELLTPLENVLRSQMLSTEQILKLGTDICRALALCEKKNIVHRDVKPANIMVSEYGDYKLGDFGIARTMDHTTNATSIGTEKYMAPEVIRREKYGKEADIYSLGLVLYWLLNNRRMPFVPTNRIPTQDEVNNAQYRRIKGDVIPEPVNGSEALKRIIKKACAYNPKDRYHSAQEMLEALQSVGNIDTDQVTEAFHGQAKTTGKQWGKENSSDNTRKLSGALGRDMNVTIGNGGEDVSKTIGTPKAARPTVSQRVQMRQKAQEAKQNEEKKRLQRIQASGKPKENKKEVKAKDSDRILLLIAAVFCFVGIPMALTNGEPAGIILIIAAPVIMYVAVYMINHSLIAGISGFVTGLLAATFLLEEIFNSIFGDRLFEGFVPVIWVVGIYTLAVYVAICASRVAKDLKNRKKSGQGD